MDWDWRQVLLAVVSLAGLTLWVLSSLRLSFYTAGHALYWVNKKQKTIVSLLHVLTGRISEHIPLVVGKSASPEFLNLITYIGLLALAVHTHTKKNSYSGPLFFSINSSSSYTCWYMSCILCGNKLVCWSGYSFTSHHGASWIAWHWRRFADKAWIITRCWKSFCSCRLWYFSQARGKYIHL